MANFPNVPDVLGVPTLLRAPGALSDTLIALTSDLISLPALNSTPQWGIFDQDGNSLVDADNVIAFEYRQDFSISDFPVELGAFESYDKVQHPFEGRMTFSRGGSQSDRQDFLNSINAIINTTDLYNIVTPEISYPSVNLTHQDYKRTATNGAGLITIELWAEQVRVSGTPSFSNTASPSGADPVNGGTVQISLPSSGELAYSGLFS